MSAANTVPGMRPPIETAVANLIRFIETGAVTEGLFAPDIFADLSLPQWRLQAATDRDIIAIRQTSHPFPGRVRVERVDQTDHGFLIEFEERWHHDGQDWYCREAIRADVIADSIVEMSIYCTGDWARGRRRAPRRHRRRLRIARPGTAACRSRRSRSRRPPRSPPRPARTRSHRQ